MCTRFRGIQSRKVLLLLRRPLTTLSFDISNMDAQLEFLDPNNVAGRQLLEISARGSSIITELLRLSAHVPDPFLLDVPGGSPQEVKERERYRAILYDFGYLSDQGNLDEAIDNNADLLDLDEEFRENHFELLGRFYSLFESIFRYVSDIQTYVEELDQGNIVSYDIEKVLLDFEGCQLMVECLYMYGVMLLLLDMRIPGASRERMVVAYYRYKGSDADNITDVVKLCRQTGFIAERPRPANYPEAFFQRFPLNKSVVDMVLNRLRTQDIYNHMSSYGTQSELRSCALASQSSMLYVILFFQPKVLATNKAIMREIVDKHFPDNWVIPFYMGFTVDLALMWATYPAAQAALANVLTRQNVTDITARHVQKVADCNALLDKYLTEGVLVDEFVLDNVNPLLNCARNCNHTLRWFLLHRTTDVKAFAQQIGAALPLEPLVRLMNHAAQFELVLKNMITTLLTEKQARWDSAKAECVGRMRELSEYFTGQKALTRVEKNERFQGWFEYLAQEIDSLTLNEQFASGRKIGRIMGALTEVEEYEQIYSSLQIKQFLEDTRT
jgi:WASH complex subunit strumpellin